MTNSYIATLGFTCKPRQVCFRYLHCVPFKEGKRILIKLNIAILVVSTDFDIQVLVFFFLNKVFVKFDGQS